MRVFTTKAGPWNDVADIHYCDPPLQQAPHGEGVRGKHPGPRLSRLELIIVDGGSSDDSAGGLADHLDPGVKIVRQPNGGSALARNRGIALAAHEWVALIDGDDLWLPYHLNELNSIRIQFPGADLIGTSYMDCRQ